MSADPITRLNAALEGRYRIDSELGEGGMATVYLADDLKHERKVALKVLKPELAAVVGAERFLAEIKTTANLQHPHILPLHDSGEADGFLFYVMPYVEGESLRERLDREHQLPVDDAVQIAKDVAEALDYAHTRGVIHRDMKPANILLQSGKPVISDFGIALAVGAAGGGRLTETGLSLGTPHYMSPEQATGDQHVGPATDIYALGCVLYEMFVGEPPYTGSTPQAVLGKIIQAKPASAIEARRSLPLNVDAAIRNALEKVPADRFESAAAFIRALGDSGFRHGDLAGAGIDSDLQRWKWLAIAFASTTAVLALTLMWSLLPPAPTGSVERLPSPFLQGQAPTGPFQVTADGSALVYVARNEDGSTQLWMRSWEELEARPIPGTEGVKVDYSSEFALSPDGREVAFVEAPAGRTVPGPLRVAPLTGDPNRTLVGRAFGASWSDDGWVYFTAGGDLGIHRVRATGESDELVIEPEQDQLEYRFPEPLPGGRHLLFALWRALDGSDAEIWALDLETHERQRLTAGTQARYAASGHLLFGTSDGQLMAAPFDAREAKLTGGAVPVEGGLATATLGGNIYFSVSRDGALAYLRGGASIRAGQELVWVSRSGAETAVAQDEAFNFISVGNASLSLSPDGTRVAFTRTDSGNNTDIWIKELPDGPMSRLTFSDSTELGPRWTPDGEMITFVSDRGLDSNTSTAGRRIWSRPANFTGQAELLYDGIDVADGVWSPDGDWLVLRTTEGRLLSGSRDLWALRPRVDSEARPLISTPAVEMGPTISRDGRWLAYHSDETDRYEVYVRPFPNVRDGKWQVSTQGGIVPVWAHNERELFFVNPSGREMMVAEFAAGDDMFRPGQPTRMFSIPLATFVHDQGVSQFYDVAMDDERFLMVRERGGNPGTVVLVQNFFAELNRLVPAS